MLSCCAELPCLNPSHLVQQQRRHTVQVGDHLLPAGKAGLICPSSPSRRGGELPQVHGLKDALHGLLGVALASRVGWCGLVAVGLLAWC